MLHKRCFYVVFPFSFVFYPSESLAGVARKARAFSLHLFNIIPCSESHQQGETVYQNLVNILHGTKSKTV